MEERKEWIKRVLEDFKAVTFALDKAFREENPNWRILKCNISGSLGRYLKGEIELFKTPYSGLSGAEARGEATPRGYLSDVDVTCLVTDETELWHKGNIVMDTENKIEMNPEKYLPRSRHGTCINFMGHQIASRYCNDPFWLPLDEPDLRRTHDVILHLRKLGQPEIFEAQFEWKLPEKQISTVI